MKFKIGVIWEMVTISKSMKTGTLIQYINSHIYYGNHNYLHGRRNDFKRVPWLWRPSSRSMSRSRTYVIMSFSGRIMNCLWYALYTPAAIPSILSAGVPLEWPQGCRWGGTWVRTAKGVWIFSTLICRTRCSSRGRTPLSLSWRSTGETRAPCPVSP